MNGVLYAGIFLACIGGCANPQIAGNGDIPKQKEYRTGSNLPIGERDRSGVSIADREAAQGALRPAGLPRPPGSGN